jgi:uncharacterized protein YjbI with pentapeptide repeats
MPDAEHADRLSKDVNAWNAWRKSSPDVHPDLSRADLSRAELSGANLSQANLSEADLTGTKLLRANLSGANLTKADLLRANLLKANLSGANLLKADLSRANLYKANLAKAALLRADLSRANLSEANLSEAALLRAVLISANLSRANLLGADLSKANLSEANLSEADLSRANLSEADLSGTNLLSTDLSGADLSDANLHAASLVAADLTDANLTGCRIDGVSTWGLKLSEGTEQKNLVIRNDSGLEITVDDIEVAQFIYLFLHSEKVRNVIDTITSKAVLILGHFPDERKRVLDALRDELRQRGYLPILFDLEGASSRNTAETVTLLVRVARFVIADISDARSVLQELSGITLTLPVRPVQPIIAATQEEPGMFDFYRQIPWFLKVYRYDSQLQLIAALGEKVIGPAEAKVQDLQGSA